MMRLQPKHKKCLTEVLVDSGGWQYERLWRGGQFEVDVMPQADLFGAVRFKPDDIWNYYDSISDDFPHFEDDDEMEQFLDSLETVEYVVVDGVELVDEDDYDD
tara:strand:+ start:1247 stop:1555 length:309 start_codon:yes stop_codon:yes gene_type:complete